LYSLIDYLLQEKGLPLLEGLHQKRLSSTKKIYSVSQENFTLLCKNFLYVHCCVKFFHSFTLVHIPSHIHSLNKKKHYIHCYEFPFVFTQRKTFITLLHFHTTLHIRKNIKKKYIDSAKGCDPFSLNEVVTLQNGAQAAFQKLCLSIIQYCCVKMFLHILTALLLFTSHYCVFHYTFNYNKKN